eukprot:m.26167 g.26167  ORF g.26167 m.26167 type:complete len:369 (+) comp11667_c0_seq1:137-1243(+)
MVLGHGSMLNMLTSLRFLGLLCTWFPYTLAFFARDFRCPQLPSYLPHSKLQNDSVNKLLYVSLLHPPKGAGRTMECTFNHPIDQIGDFVDFHLEHALNDTSWKLRSFHGHDRYAFTVQALDRLSACPGVKTLSVALLRHPVARALSEFYTDRGRSAAEMLDPITDLRKIGHTLASGELARRMQLGNITLEQYATWPHVEDYQYNDNRMTNMLTSYSLDDKRLALAKKRLATFDIVVIQEHFEQSLALLNCHVQVLTGRPLAKVHRCSNFNPYSHNISPLIKQALLQRNSLDVELYNYGMELHREQLAVYKDHPCMTKRYFCQSDAQCYKKKAMTSPFASYNELMSKYSRATTALGELSSSLICIQTCT